MSLKKYQTKEERLAARRAQYARPEYRLKRIAQTRTSQLKRQSSDPEIGSKMYRRRLELDPRWNQRIQLRKYGLTLEEYEMRLDTQNYVCIICKESETDIIYGKVKGLAVDHVPDKPKTFIRDLPCSKCNRGLGLFRDNPVLLREAADYLERWGQVYG